MNPVDIASVAILLVSALFGLARGFVREVLGLGAWIGAAAGAVIAFPIADPFFRAGAARLGVQPGAGDVACGIVTFLVLLLVLSAIANAGARLVRATPFGGLDRLLGLAFGVVRGAAILVVAYVLAGMLVPPGQWPEMVRRAAATPLAFAGARWAVTVVPSGARPHVAAPESGATAGQKV